jgi:hypothetical protein
LRIRFIVRRAIASNDAQGHQAGAIRTGRCYSSPIISFACHEAGHEAAVAQSGAALTLWGYVWTIVDEVPSVEVVHVTIAIVVYAGLAVRFGFVGPELVAEFFVVYVCAVVKHGNDDGLCGLSVAPRERPCDIINPP